ncbi:formyltetrahydrofolate deformylase 2, mitochondrial isoform X3 [Physcomitrium patens]|uniref:formyltetrahydrofolate deformylase 2, mitochondrial isoform X3 n=1 Tax=Physcomitrium patens TaxID=3218 RepID=UPI000D172525|nr:formyltetrahydrofolate deformylase 2, mitochondrial-like isoform X3 [Physcomitrium patens]|eukprot:XP_024394459.1 formyltetrahydrofolate deformylase 2, mitochondrial-like isoform X3 [Physcomitrella patens]
MLLGKALRDVWARRNSCSLGLLRELRRSYGCNAIGSHESRRARCYEGKGECEGGSPGEVHGVHVFQCAISTSTSTTRNSLQSFMHEELAHHFKAEKSVVRVLGSDPDLKLAVLASWQDHCLIDLLHRWQEGELPANLSCVIRCTTFVSNHNRGPNTHVLRFLERHGIPYHYLPTSKGNKREEEILDLVSGTDFLVLARYMQVLSPTFLKGYKKDIINIHHGLLPSFKGANPYRQAYEAGVKLIGATSHFVTEELDDGPIIEQMVDMVSHRDSLHTFATRSENLEKQCLAKAIKYYCEQRIMRYSTNKTIVFC